jgi:hypothetical protein
MHKERMRSCNGLYINREGFEVCIFVFNDEMFIDADELIGVGLCFTSLVKNSAFEL